MKQDQVLIESLVAEIQVSYNPQVKISTLPKLHNSQDVYKLFIDTWDKSKIDYVEQFKALLLNRANRVLGICLLSSGSTTGTVADPKQVFSVALKANACSIVIAHNHPSGNLNPSKSDEEITSRMKLAGALLDIKVIDHLIVTSEGYYSFADEGTI